MRLGTFESRIEFQARLKPASMAAGALTEPQLLLHPLEDEDVRVDRHADRQDEGGDAGQGQGHRYEPEQGEDHERVIDERAAATTPGSRYWMIVNAMTSAMPMAPAVRLCRRNSTPSVGLIVVLASSSIGNGSSRPRGR